MIKKLIKNNYINIIFILLSFISFILTDNLENMVFFIIGSVLFSIAFCFKNNRKETKTDIFKYDLLTRTKKVVLIVLILSILILGYLVTISKGWDSLGYAVIFILFIYQFFSFCLVNIIFRLYYLIRYKQKLEIKEFFRNNYIYLIFFTILIIISICLYYTVA